MAQINFNASEFEDRPVYEPLPTGWYLACITNSEIRENSSGTGEYLLLTLEILEGEYQGRKVFDRLNINHPNEQVVHIARSTLATICRAVGILTPEDTEDLHDRPLRIKVGVKRRTDTGELTNEIRGYANKDQAGSKTVTTTDLTKNTSGKKEPPPWAKK